MTQDLRWGRRVVLPAGAALLALSLTVNVVLLAGGPGHVAASEAPALAMQDVAPPPPDAPPDAPSRIAALTDALSQERRDKEKLHAKISQMAMTLIQQKESQKSIRARYVVLSDQLSAVKAENQRLRAGTPVQATAPASETVLFLGSEATIPEAVAALRERVAARASRTATRRIGTMAGEALPWLGTSVAGAVAGMDLADLCQTIRDVSALERAIDPAARRSPEELTVCSLPVPDARGLWASVEADPERAWWSAMEFAPPLLAVQGADMPSIDWAGYRDATAGEGLSLVAEAAGTDAESLRGFLTGFEAGTRPAE